MMERRAFLGAVAALVIAPFKTVMAKVVSRKIMLPPFGARDAHPLMNGFQSYWRLEDLKGGLLYPEDFYPGERPHEPE